MKIRLLMLAAIILIGIGLVVAYLYLRNRDGGATRVQPFETVIPAGDRPDSAFSDEERLAPPVAAFKGPKGEYGFINRFGFVVIKPQYKLAHDFLDDCAVVYSESKCSIIDFNGKERFPTSPGVRQLWQGLEKMVWYRTDNDEHWGLMDKTGRVVLKPTYDRVRQFSDGNAAVNIGAKFKFPGRWMGGKWGFIDSKGVVVIPIENESVGSFSEGLALIENRGKRFVDKEGKTVFELPVSSFRTGDFSEGLAPANVSELGGEKDDVTHFIDRQGKTEFRVDGIADSFREGLAANNLFCSGEVSRRSAGFIDRQGKFAIAPQFVEVRSFNEGLAEVRVKQANADFKDALWGYVDKKGIIRIRPQFHVVHPFHGGIALVQIGGKYTSPYDARPYWADGEWWLIDQSGRKLKRSWIGRE